MQLEEERKANESAQAQQAKSEMEMKKKYGMQVKQEKPASFEIETTSFE